MEDKISQQNISDSDFKQKDNSNNYEILLNKLNDIKERISLLEKTFFHDK